MKDWRKRLQACCHQAKPVLQDLLMGPDDEATRALARVLGDVKLGLVAGALAELAVEAGGLGATKFYMHANTMNCTMGRGATNPIILMSWKKGREYVLQVSVRVSNDGLASFVVARGEYCRPS